MFRLSCVHPSDVDAQSSCYCRGADSPANSAMQVDEDLPTKSGKRTNSASRLPPATAERPRKRAKLDSPLRADPLGAWLTEIRTGDNTKGKIKRLWSLQALAMWMELHPQKAAALMSDALLNEVAHVAKDSDEDVVNWATITLASAANALRKNGIQATQWKGWEEIWTLVAKRVLLPHLSRTSACLANTLLEAGLINPQTHVADFSAMLLGLSSQAISRPSEAICELVTRSLDIVDSNRASVDPSSFNSTLALLQGLWIPNSSTLGSSNVTNELASGCPPPAMLYLFKSVCRLERCPQLIEADVFLEPTPIISHMRENIAHKKMLRFMLFADLNAHSSTRRIARGATSSAALIDLLDLPLEPEAPSTRIYHSLLAALKGTQETICGTGLHTGTASPVEVLQGKGLRQCANLAVLSILFNCLLRYNGYHPSDDLLNAAVNLLNIIVSETSKRNRSLSERAVAIAALAPLSAQPDRRREIPIISTPTKRSAVRHAQLAGPLSRGSNDHQLQTFFKCGLTFNEDDTALAAPVNALKAVIKLLSDEAEPAPEPQEQVDAMDADFEEVKIVSEAAHSARADEVLPGSVKHHIALGTFKVLATIHAFGHKNNPSLSTQKGPVQLLMEKDANFASAMLLLPCIVEVDASGFLPISDEELTEILAIVGEEIMPQYQYSHDPAAHNLALDVIHCVLRRNKFAQESAELRDMCRWLMTHVSKSKSFFSWSSTNRIALLLSEFLTIEEMTEIWEPDGECISPNHPISIVQALCRAPDFRIRFRTATLIGAIFNDTVIDDPVVETNLWAQIQDLVPADHTLRERTLTRLLLYGNIAVLSSSQRSPSLGTLMETSIRDQSYDAHVKCILTAVAAQLGFNSSQEIFATFAAPFLFSLHNLGLDPLNIPWSVFGYESQRQWASENLPTMGMMVLELRDEPRSHFGVLCKRARVPITVAYEMCRPIVVAFELGDLADDAFNKNEKVSSEDLWMGMLDAGGKCEQIDVRTPELVQKVVECKDQIAAWLMNMTWFPAQVLDDEVLLQIASVDKSYVDSLRKLTTGAADLCDNSPTHEPARPFLSSRALISALRSLDEHTGGIFDEVNAYHILNHTLDFIATSRLVNDQIRALRSVSLYLAMSYNTVNASPPLLALLIRRFTAFLKQTDLIPISANLLNWCWSTAKFRASSLPEWIPTLTDAALSAATLRMTALLDSTLSRRASQFRHWLKALLNRALSNSSSQKSAINCLIFWPDAISEEVTNHLDALSIVEFTAALSTLPSLPVSTATLRRIAAKLKAAPRDTIRAFADDCLWLLKLQSGNPLRPREEEVEFSRLLAQLLTVCGGSFRMPSAPACTRLSAVTSAALRPMFDGDSCDDDEGTSLVPTIIASVIASLVIWERARSGICKTLLA